jgi:hypothetical protein
MNSMRTKVMIYLQVNIFAHYTERKKIYQGYFHSIHKLIRHCHIIANVYLYFECHGHYKIKYNF